eukprot:s3657_g2.t6
MTYDTGDVAVQATETSCVGEPEMGRSADAEGDASPGKPMVWEVLSQRIEAEALERATAISRLTSFIEDAVASINQNLMDAAAQAGLNQGAQKSKEETLPATWSGLEDVRKTISKLSETQTQQEDRIRGLAHKVDQVSGSHDILDRDQKATFREMSNSISDLNIKLGSRTSRLEEDFKALQEEVTSLQIEIRSTLNGALMTPSRSLSGVVCEGTLWLHRLQPRSFFMLTCTWVWSIALIEQLVAENELEIQRLKKTNEKLQHELLQKPEVSGSFSSQEAPAVATSAALTGFEHHIPLREVARSDDLDASILGPLDSTFGHSSHFVPVPVQKHQVDLVIHGIQGVVLDLVPSPPSPQSRGSDGQKCRCKLKIHLGSEIHETEWAELRKDLPLPGSPQETWGAVWEQNAGPLKLVSKT